MTQKRTNWKEQYLRILTSGVSGPEDYAAAVELINDGYAIGQAQFSKGRDTYGEVTTLVGFQVTTKGRLFSDELASKTRSARLKDLAIKAAIAVVSAAFGLGLDWLRKLILS